MGASLTFCRGGRSVRFDGSLIGHGPPWATSRDTLRRSVARTRGDVRRILLSAFAPDGGGAS